MKKTLIPIALVFTLVALAPAALGASPQTANLGLSATVINNCTISTTPVAFVNYDPLSGSVNQATGTLVVACTKNATPTIELGNGLWFATNRKMKDAGGQLMDYEIYKPSANTAGAVCAYTQRWGTAAEIFTPAVVANKSSRTYNVCGQIAAGQDLSAAATFADTVVATINF